MIAFSNSGLLLSRGQRSPVGEREKRKVSSSDIKLSHTFLPHSRPLSTLGDLEVFEHSLTLKSVT